jgi:hypothetical protein
MSKEEGPVESWKSPSLVWENSRSKDQFILTPFFLDAPVPGLKLLAGRDWIINEPPLPDGRRPMRIGVIQAALVGTD